MTTIQPGPIARHVMRSTNVYSEANRFQRERDYPADIAEALGANCSATVLASILDAMVPPRVPVVTL